MAAMERMTSSAALDQLAAEYWDAYLEANPLNATAMGDPRFDDRLADHTSEGSAATIGRFENLLARADAIDPAEESPADRTTLSALRGSLAADHRIQERDQVDDKADLSEQHQRERR